MIEYWLQRLKDAPALALPSVGPRTAERTDGRASYRFQVRGDIADRLRQLAADEHATLFVGVLAAYLVLLYRYSGQTDILVGTPGEMLVFRTDVAGDPTYRALMQRAFDVVVEAEAHRDVRFERIVERLQPDRRPGDPSLFQAALAVQSGSAPLDGDKAICDLTLTISEAASGWAVDLHYSTDIFDEPAIARMAGHFVRILGRVAANPDVRLSDIDLLRPDERKQILIEWNDTRRPRNETRGMHELFEEQAARTPDAIAVLCGAERMTYRDLNRRANQVAWELRQHGVDRGAAVGVLMERSASMIAALYGVLKAGGAYVPLDPAYPAERLRTVLDDCRPACLITEERLRDRLIDYSGRIVEPQAIWAADIAFNTDLPGIVTPRDLAYFIYTSGSTGRPKGVMIEHHSAVEMIAWAQEVFPADALSCVLASTSICFDLSVYEIFVPLSCGGSVRVVQNILEWGQSAHTGGVTLINTVPSALRELVASRRLPSDVRIVNVAGEALPAVLVEETFARADGLHAMFNLYGPSEDTTYSTFTAVDPGTPPLIGKAVSNSRVFILDACGMPAPQGVPGEICIAGAGLARGYWDRPELTAERFVPDGFSREPGARMYRTGDLGRWAATGDIEYLGRLDHQVKIRGHRIELGEIESLLKRHESVASAVVIAREEPSGDKRLAAYVVFKSDGGDAAVSELRTYLARKLPAYMVPSFIVRLDDMPLTPNGKIDRRKLPAPPEVAIERAFRAPGTSAEERLAAIWLDVLGIGRVSADDNFFELGGHSLLAMRMVSRVREAFGIELPLRRVLEQPVLRDLAASIADGHTEDSKPIVRRTHEGAMPLSSGEQGIFLLQQLDADSWKFNMAYAARMQGELNHAALERAIAAMIARHETLRTRYAMRGEPERFIDEPPEYRLPIVEAAGEDEAQRLIREQSRKPFDLERGPLFRALVIRLSERAHIFAMTVHHAIGDAWSMDVWSREIGILYRSFLDGREAQLPDLPVQYADYARWQRERVDSERQRHQLAYWRKRLADAPKLDLPTVHERPPVQSQRGATYRFEIPEAVAEAFKNVRVAEEATLFAAVLAAFNVLLHRYSGQTDLVVGTPTSVRNRAELEGLFGFFLNTIVLRTDLTGNRSFRELLRHVKNVTHDAYSNQDVPFDRVVRELLPDRDLSRATLFSASLVVQHAPEAWDLPGLAIECTELYTGTAKLDIALFVTERESGWIADFEYSTDLFDEPAMANMAGDLVRVIEQVAAQPDVRIADIELSPHADRTRVRASWIETGAAADDRRAVHELFEEQAALTPEATAVVFGGNSLTYRELNERANQLARYLGRFAGDGSRVAIRLERSIGLVVAVVAALKAGAAYVPIDPEHPGDRQRFTLADARAAVLVTQRSLPTIVGDDDLPAIYLDTDWPAIAREPRDNVSRLTDPDDLLYLIYTSGSTGRPKGVALPHRALVNLLHWYWSGLARSVRILQFASICFDVATLEIFSALCSGGTVVMTDDETRRDISRLATLVSDARVQQLFVPVVVLDLLARELCARNLPVPELKELITAGEQLQVTHPVRALCERTGCSLHNQYGPSEAHVVTGFTLRGAPESWPSQPPIGRPISGTRAYVVDSLGSPVPVGAPGEVWIGGIALAHGYWDRPDLTAERFIPDGLSGESGARLYRTGDLGRWDANGQIEYLGRIDHQVKIRGHRIELGEIETVLCGHRAVAQAIVVVSETAPGDKRLVAYVVLKPGTDESAVAALRPHLQRTLPDYMLPSAIVPLADMPLNANGKVDRRRLPAPDAARSASYVAPGTPTEERLASLWQDVLGRSEIGVEENFFELGGHSLLAMQLASRMHETFNLKVPLRVIFNHPTVRACANAIDTNDTKDTKGTKGTKMG
jgi:amino acid adenylation domain-containing protein